MENHYVTLHWDKGKHDFQLKGGPIDNPEGAEIVFQILGRAACAWGRLENHIDAILIHLNKPEHSAGSRNLYDPKHPRPVSGKIKLLNRYFANHPALEPYKEDIRMLAERLPIIAGDRNGILHGILEDYSPSKRTITINSMNVHPQTGTITARKDTFPLEKVEEFTRTTVAANGMLFGISSHLFTATGLAQLRKPEE